MRYLTIIVLAFSTLSCSDKQPPVTKTEVRWEGATAEQLEEFVPSIAPTLKLAIIRDEEAEVYHQADLATVRAELADTSSIHPAEGFSVSESTAIEGPFPTPPETAAEMRSIIEVNADKLDKQGLTLAEVMRSLDQLGIQPGVEPVSAATFAATSVTRTDGTEVPLNQIATRTEKEVERPVIIDRR